MTLKEFQQELEKRNMKRSRQWINILCNGTVTKPKLEFGKNKDWYKETKTGRLIFNQSALDKLINME